MIIHPEKVVNEERAIVYVQNTGDTFHYNHHLRPFLSWIQQDTGRQNRIYQSYLYLNLNHPQDVTDNCILSFPTHKGLNIVLFHHPDGHSWHSRDFELPIIDNVLRSMARQAQRPRSDAP